MSEVVTGAIAGAAVAACVAAAGVVVITARAVYKTLNWLSAQAQREFERLERELAIQTAPSHTTTTEAKAELKKRLQQIKARVEEIPLLRGHSDAVAQTLTLRQATLRSFINETEWRNLHENALTPTSFEQLVQQAGKRFTQANALYVSQSIVEVANNVGFSQQRTNRRSGGKQALVLQDNQGRALVAEVVGSDDSAKINLDLTGFGDGSCHVMMDRILEGLAQKNIRLDLVRRRSHYRREGVLSTGLDLQKKESAVTTVADNSGRKLETDKRRRQTYYGKNKLKL